MQIQKGLNLKKSLNINIKINENTNTNPDNINENNNNNNKTDKINPEILNKNMTLNKINHIFTTDIKGKIL